MIHYKRASRPYKNNYYNKLNAKWSNKYHLQYSESRNKASKSEVYGLTVAVTNQINEHPDDFRGPFSHKPVGGNVMAHASASRIRAS